MLQCAGENPVAHASEKLGSINTYAGTLCILYVGGSRDPAAHASGRLGPEGNLKYMYTWAGLYMYCRRCLEPG